MSRGIGETEFVSQLPDAVTAIAGLVTQLGDMWFVLFGIGVLLVLGVSGRELVDDHWKNCTYLFALTIGAYSLTVILKHSFALSRPPGAATATLPSWIPPLASAAYESMVTGDGYGFPSGHALKTTVVYGGAAFTLQIWDRNRQIAVAGAISVLVAASRVVLGVHYVVDVAVGVVVGVLFLATTMRLTDGRPTRALALSTVLGGLAFASAGSYKSGVAFATAAVAFAVWATTDRFARVGAEVTEG